MKTLPAWVHTDTGWECDDDFQMQIAIICELNGFNLPGFDMWLVSLPECEMKAGMLERRAQATESLLANDRNAALRHLELMQATMRHDKREQFLLPLAKRDKARQDGTKKERKPEINKWIAANIKKFPNKRRLERWADAPDWISDQIGQDSFVKRVSAVIKNNKK